MDHIKVSLSDFIVCPKIVLCLLKKINKKYINRKQMYNLQQDIKDLIRYGMNFHELDIFFFQFHNSCLQIYKTMIIGWLSRI